jgi:addiction module RelE/StbE family toxin
VVKVIFDLNFKKDFKKIKDNSIKERIIKQISKIKENPEIGKLMRFDRKGSRELYVSPWRLSYKVEGEIIYFVSIS